jgi:hypothetical protein
VSRGTSSLIDYSNPFSVSYLTEASLTVSELLNRYSFQPLRYVHSELSTTHNVFLVGRKGVGKTMVLKIFDPDIMAVLYRSREPEHVEARKFLPKATVGVYLNLVSPSARLSLFRGPQHDESWWLRAYADYLNALLMELALSATETLAATPGWRTDANASSASLIDTPEVFGALIDGLREESTAYEPIKSLSELRALFRGRIRDWARYVNGDPGASPPSQSALPLGAPLFRFVSAVRSSGLCGEPFRLFVLIDQYEVLHQQRRVIDFRPMFNQAMYSASRGGTGVEFKIGTRQYSYGNLDLPNGAGRIEAYREMLEVNFDDLSKTFYKKFALELYEKRLGGNSRQSAEERLPELKARAEAELYVGESVPDRHLTAFLQKWQSLGLSEAQVAAAEKTSQIRSSHVLTGTLACIAVTRWLRDGSKKPPLGCSPTDEADPGEALGTYLDQLVRSIDEREKIGGEAARRKDAHMKAVDDFVRDVEEAALFQLASAYKNQRKYFSGIDSIVALSSNVAIVLIEILRAAYEPLILAGHDARTVVVTPELQSAAIYRTATNWFNRIPKECDFGETHQRFLSALGGHLRRIQLALTAPQPCPNGFSVGGAEASDIGGAAQEDPRTNAKALIADAVSWGLMEESEHQDKTRGRPKRRKFYLNRIFCPYFGVSEIWKKDPIYVRKVDVFVKNLLDGEPPVEVTNLLRDGGDKAPPPSPPPQRRLFE